MTGALLRMVVRLNNDSVKNLQSNFLVFLDILLCYVLYAGHLKLHLEQKFITAAAGCAQIPCGFTDLPTAYMAIEIWFKGSPESPLGPEEVERTNGLSRALSTLKECSIILWDLIGLDRTEEYGFMLKLATNERHIFPETVQVSYSAGMYLQAERV